MFSKKFLLALCLQLILYLQPSQTSLSEQIHLNLKSQADKNPTSSTKHTSTVLTWMYERSGALYYFKLNKALEDFSDRVRFEYIFGEPPGQITILSRDSLEYLQMDSDGFLTSSPNLPETSFFAMPEEGNPAKFTLWVDNLPLVTPMLRAPFSFYNQSVFPDESPAIFSLAPYILNITDLYGGKASNLFRVIRVIQDMDVDQDVAFAELIDLMTTLGHLPGVDIFPFAQIVYNSTGFNRAFALFPPVVRALTTGGPVRLHYMNSSTPAPMSGNYAPQNPGDIEHFRFTNLLNGTELTTAITYGLNGQLYLNGPFDHLDLATTDYKYYSFKLRLNDDLVTFGIQYPDSSTRLKGKQHALPNLSMYFYFLQGQYPADFTAVPYELDLESIYKGQRENILKTAGFIQESVVLNKSEAYAQLLHMMEENGHLAQREIFELAAGYILPDVGEEDEAFALLPQTVQHICREGQREVSLNANSSTGVYPMKLHWASDLHENIEPYAFAYSREMARFSLTYGEDYQLSVPASGLGDLFGRRSAEYEFVFDLYLNPDLEQISVVCSESGEVLRALSQTPDIYYTCAEFGSMARFSVNYNNILDN